MTMFIGREYKRKLVLIKQQSVDSFVLVDYVILELFLLFHNINVIVGSGGRVWTIDINPRQTIINFIVCFSYQNYCIITAFAKEVGCSDEWLNAFVLFLVRLLEGSSEEQSVVGGKNWQSWKAIWNGTKTNVNCHG